MAGQKILTLQAFIHDLHIVVVTHGLPAADCTTLLRLSRISEHEGIPITAAVFDNSPELTTVPCKVTNMTIDYTPLPGNPGIGTAYNKAAEQADTKRKKWLLFFDQDAELPENCLREYHSAILQFPEEHLFCPRLRIRAKTIISPARFHRNRAAALQAVPSGPQTCRSWTIANNGLLLSTIAFAGSGGYHPSIPLDFSDTYFFEKFKRVFSSFIVVDCDIPHRLDSILIDQRERALTRFRLYCRGAKIFAQEFSRYGEVYIYSVLRALKLSIKFRSPRFFAILQKEHFRRMAP